MCDIGIILWYWYFFIFYFYQRLTIIIMTSLISDNKQCWTQTRSFFFLHFMATRMRFQILVNNGQSTGLGGCCFNLWRISVVMWRDVTWLNVTWWSPGGKFKNFASLLPWMVHSAVFDTSGRLWPLTCRDTWDIWWKFKSSKIHCGFYGLQSVCKG